MRIGRFFLRLIIKRNPRREIPAGMKKYVDISKRQDKSRKIFPLDVATHEMVLYICRDGK